MSKQSIRTTTNQPGVYQNQKNGKYDVKYSYTEYNPISNEKKRRTKWIYGINSYKTAVATLANLRIEKTREFTTNELEKLGFRVLPSKANFVFAESDAVSGEELYLKLKEMGVLVRHFTSDRIKNFNRITIGTPEQMQILLTAIQSILEE